MLRPHHLISPVGAAALIVAGCQATPPETTAYEPTSPPAQQVIDHYLADVRGKYGALAISADGSRAAYHICSLHQIQYCDETYSTDNLSWSPSGQIAAKTALSRCGSGCRVLYINDMRRD
jgi:hypothetical protein